MDIELSYTEANARYPEQVRECMAALRGGRSKNKGAAPEDLKWTISWSVRIEGDFSFEAMMEGIANPKPKPELTEDETVADYARRANFGIVAHKGVGRWGSRTSLPMPKECEDNIRANYKEGKKEKARFDSMTNQEREAEVESLLSQLRGPGFIELRVERREDFDG